MVLAGTPPTIVYGATSLVTTAPAAMMLWCPMFTPLVITALAPIHTSSSMVISAVVTVCWSKVVSGLSNPWFSQLITTPGATIT